MVRYLKPASDNLGARLARARAADKPKPQRPSRIPRSAFARADELLATDNLGDMADKFYAIETHDLADVFKAMQKRLFPKPKRRRRR
jgi:hypothetical protein